MSRKTKLWIIIMSLFFACHRALADDTLTFIFQQGMDHGYGIYADANDITIKAPTVVGVNAQYLRIGAQYPSGNEWYNSLIQFKNIAEPLQGLEVVQAYITLTYNVYGSQVWVEAVIDSHPLLKDFSDEEADWYNADPDIPWELPAAGGVSDRGEPPFSTGMGPRSSTQLYEEGQKFPFDLPTELVQSWLDDPNCNHGIIMTMDPVAATVEQFYSSDFEGDPNNHPLLTIIARPRILPCYASIPADLNNDCYVNWVDLNIMKGQWLECKGGSADIYDDQDGCVNLLDYNVFAGMWLQCSDPLNNLCSWSGEKCGSIPADLNDDCYVTQVDLWIMYEQWLDCEGGSADLYDDGDGCVNLLDFNVFAGQWLQCSVPRNSLCTWK